MYAGAGYVLAGLGTRRGFGVSILACSTAQILHAVAIGKWSLAGMRFLLGLAEPGNWPAAAKAVAEWFPASQRALGVGIFNSGSSLGSAIAAPLVAFLTLRYGWQSAFVVTGALGLVWLAAWLVLYQPPHKNRWLRPAEYDEIRDQVRPPEETGPVRTSIDWQRILRNRGCDSMVLGGFVTGPVIYFVIFFLPYHFLPP